MLTHTYNKNNIPERHELKTTSDGFGSRSRPRSFASAKTMPARTRELFQGYYFLILLV